MREMLNFALGISQMYPVELQAFVIKDIQQRIRKPITLAKKLERFMSLRKLDNRVAFLIYYPSAVNFHLSELLFRIVKGHNLKGTCERHEQTQSRIQTKFFRLVISRRISSSADQSIKT